MFYIYHFATILHGVEAMTVVGARIIINFKEKPAQNKAKQSE